MGEFWALTKEERNRAVAIVVEEAKGKCKVIAHTGHHAPDETVDLTRFAQDAGADFATIINPYYPFPRRMSKHPKALALGIASLPFGPRDPDGASLKAAYRLIEAALAAYSGRGRS